MDIRSFFPSIHRSTLANLLKQQTSNLFLRWLIDTCFLHDARIKAKNYCKLHLQNLVPKENSWFSKAADFGLPIGNLTSQFGANIYLNDIDHFIQRQIQPKGYLRYVDDLTFIDTDKDKLKNIISIVSNYLFNTRMLEFNESKTKLTKLTEGIKLLGYKIKQTSFKHSQSPNSTQILLPKKKKWEFINSLRHSEKLDFCERTKLHEFFNLKSNNYNRNKLAKINARLGHMSHADCYTFKKTTLEKYITQTSIKEFNIQEEKQEHWNTLKTSTHFTSLKIRKRLKKICS